MNDSIELQKTINAAVRNWWLLIVATVVGALLGLIVSQQQIPVYSASTTLLVGQSIQSTELESRDMAISQQMALTYAKLARLQPVLQTAAERLDTDIEWKTLANHVRATPVEGTLLLKITVEAASPQEAMILADSIAESVISLSPAIGQGKDLDENQQFVRGRLDFLRANIRQGQQRVEALEGEMLATNTTAQMLKIQAEIDAIQGLIAGWEGNYARMAGVIKQPGSPNSLTVVESAQGSTNPVRPRIKLNMLVMALVGFALAFGAVVYREIVDDTIRATSDFPDDLDLEILGTIGRIRGKDKLITARNASSPISRAYAMALTAIRSKFGIRAQTVILITSSYANEGKSTTAANLGVVMAQAGLQTIIADMNFARPQLHKIFKVPEEGGMTDALQSHEINLQSLLKETNIATLQVLTSGTQFIPSKRNANNGYHSEDDDIERPQINKLAPHLKQILTRLGGLADVVILDGSPLLTTVDAAILSGQADGVVLVIKAGQTRSTSAQQAVAILHGMEANLIGGVLTAAPRLRN